MSGGGGNLGNVLVLQVLLGLEIARIHLIPPLAFDHHEL
jgi:hypothetical protein